MYAYTPKNAKIYSELGIVGTTYEVSFNEMAGLLGNLSGKTVLDYGTGAGRSAWLLQTLGAQKVIGVDHDENMINQAKLNTTTGIEFYKTEQDAVPLPDNSVDAAISTHVFVEMTSVAEMLKAAGEIARVLKPGGIIIVIVSNPESIGHDYVSYRYEKKENLHSGDSVACTVKGKESFEIHDTYWTQHDYQSVLEQTGFKNIEVSYPKADGPGWLEETSVAPDVVFKGIKPL